MKKIKDKKVILAYSGGLDTSAIIPWIKEHYGFKVIAFIADLGQSKNDLENIEEKALTSGADDTYLVDLKEEFIANYVYPILQTGALYEGNYLLGTAMARPIIAKKQVELALRLNAVALCHGATGKGNDQVRFESVYAALAPHLNILAPWRLWNLRSREELINYLKHKNIKTTATLEKIYSRDENAWHVSTEGGHLENPWYSAKEDTWTWTIDPEKSPNQSENVSILVNKGLVVSVNNVYMTPFKCLEILNKIGCKHGIGRIDIVENRLVGIKSRGCYETPGGTIIVRALREIEQLVLDRESFQWREKLGLEMASIVYDGKWFTPLRKSLQASATSLSNEVSGEVVLKLYKGNIITVKKRSKNTLYSKEFATFGNDEVYDHTDASGFIKIFSLSSKIRAIKQSGYMGLWGGRFTQKSSVEFQKFNNSLLVDYCLVEYDIFASIAWSRALMKANVISEMEHKKIKYALSCLLEKVKKNPEEILSSNTEDIHSWIEEQLIISVGSLGKKLHTGRSRNDQVTTDLKLWCKVKIKLLIKIINDFQKILIIVAEANSMIIMPGYTHLQRAQPITFAFWCIAYIEMMKRDIDRLKDLLKRIDVSPLGSGALAGTSWNIDRTELAISMGFSAATRNALDSVSDRDYVVELLSIASISMLHLARFSEDLIFFNSGEANFIELSDDITSGSSLMPQKKNPDVLELIRAKTARVHGSLMSILILLKGLPLAYNKDMQEDKSILFSAIEIWENSLNMSILVLKNITVNQENCRNAAKKGYSNATELADYLVRKGVPFRDSHKIVGKIVLEAIKLRLSLEDIELSILQTFSSLITKDVYQYLALESCIKKRNSQGGVAFDQVYNEINNIKIELGLV